MLPRTDYLRRMDAALNRSPIVAILGPRQVGKTTLARFYATDRQVTRFDVESVLDRRRLENPEWVLGRLSGLVIIDEIQLMPELFSVLRVLADRPNNTTRFLILGSASPNIVRNVSETLAGRIEFIELSGFDLSEVGYERWESLWLRGGFPRAYLADTLEDSTAWREGLIRTFLERDIPQLGISIPAPAMRRFWTMLAHYHGQTWNGAKLGRAMGRSGNTARSYLDILTGTFMTRQLQPWYTNIGKRQVKSPKVYLRDSGLLHTLLGLKDLADVLAHPQAGASWEGFVIEQTISLLQIEEAYFWSTHAGAELDLFFTHRGRHYGVEVKLNEAPGTTRSMRIAIEDLDLEQLWIIHPGPHTYEIDDRISAVSIGDLESIGDHLQRL